MLASGWKRAAVLLVLLGTSCATPRNTPTQRMFLEALRDYAESAPPVTACHLGLLLQDDTLRVSRVYAGARSAGLEPGDVVTSADGQPVRSERELAQHTQQRESGESVDLRLERDGEPVVATVACSDTRERNRLTFEILSAGSTGDWDRCMAESLALEEVTAPMAWIAGVRMDCSEAKRSRERRSPTREDAELAHEYGRRLLEEGRGSSAAIASRRDDILFTISWLEEKGFRNLGADLRAGLATETAGD